MNCDSSLHVYQLLQYGTNVYADTVVLNKFITVEATVSFMTSSFTISNSECLKIHTDVSWLYLVRMIGLRK